MARTMQSQRRSSRRSSRSNTPRPVVPLRVGDWLDVMDTYGMWNVARVLSRPSPGEVEITYDGWPDEFDEVVHIDSHRVAPYHTFTYAVKCWVKYLNWPMWPAVITIRTPGTEEGIVNLRDDKRFHVDFFDHPDFEHRDRCWQKSQKGRLAAFHDKYEERRRRSNGHDFECSLERALQSDATTKMPTFGKGMLPVEYENGTTKSVEEMRKEMGEELWLKNFLNNRERHCRTHVYDAIGGSLVNDDKKKVGTTDDEALKVKIKLEKPLRATRKAARSKKESPGSPKASRSSTVLEENPSDDVEVPHNLSSGSSEEESSDEDAVAVVGKRPRLRTRRTAVPKTKTRVMASVEVKEKSSDDVVEIPYALNDSSSGEESVDDDGGMVKGRRRRLRTRRATGPKTTSRVMASVEIEEKSSDDVQASYELIGGSSEGKRVDKDTSAVKGKRRCLRTRPAKASESTNEVMGTVDIKEKLADGVEISNDASSGDQSSANDAPATKRKRPRLRSRSAVAPESTKQRIPSVELEQQSLSEVSPSEVETPYEPSDANSGGESGVGNAREMQETRHRQITPSAVAVSNKLKVTKGFSQGNDGSVAPVDSSGLEGKIPNSSQAECSSEGPREDANKPTEPHRHLLTMKHDKRDAVAVVAFTRNANSSSKTTISVPRKFDEAPCNGHIFKVPVPQGIPPPPPLRTMASFDSNRPDTPLVSASSSVFSSSDRFSLDSWFRRKLYADFMAGGTQ